MERYATRAYRIALGITRDAEGAGDVVQNAVCNVLRNVDAFRDDAALASWLYRIVTKAACQRARPPAYQRAEIALEDVLPRFHEDGAPVVMDDWSLRLNDRATVDRARAALNAAIDELSPDDRAVVVLCDAEG